MLSKLEKAINSNILPISVDIFCEDAYLIVDIVEGGFWVGYENSGHGEIGPSRTKLSDYPKTLDEAVDKLIPILWEEIYKLNKEVNDNGENYALSYYMELMYDVKCESSMTKEVWTIPSLPLCEPANSEARLIQNKQEYFEFCFSKNINIPLPTID